MFLAREDGANAAAAQAMTEGVLLGDFEGDKYKTGGKKDHAIEMVELAGWDDRCCGGQSD